MKCPQCGKENEENKAFCVMCGAELTSGSFSPDWKWHIKVLAVIYIVLASGYLVLKMFL